MELGPSISAKPAGALGRSLATSRKTSGRTRMYAPCERSPKCRLIRYGASGLIRSVHVGSITAERAPECTTNAPTCVNDIMGQRCV